MHVKARIKIRKTRAGLAKSKILFYVLSEKVLTVSFEAFRRPRKIFVNEKSKQKL